MMLERNTIDVNEEISVVGVMRDLALLIVKINKMILPVFLGGIIVATPYVLALSYIADVVSSWGGTGLAAVALGLTLLVTMVPIALLTIIVVFCIDEWLPWDGIAGVMEDASDAH